MRSGIGLAAALIVLAALPVSATAQDAASCALIPADAQRLACYDALFGGAPATEREGAVVIASEQMIPARPSGRDQAQLTIACEAGQLQVLFGFAGQLVSITGNNGAITFQFDQNPPFVRNLPASQSNTELGYFTSTESRMFLGQFAGADTLRVRIQPVNSRSLAVDFRVAAAYPEIQAVSEACR